MSVICRETETAEVVYPREKAAWENLISVYKHQREGVKKVDPDSFLQCPVT